MESGNAISTPLLLQEPLFLLDSQCPLEAMHGFHWMRSLPSQFSMPIMSCCPILPSPGQSNFLAQTPLYLVTIQQLLVMQYFQRKYFGRFTTPSLSDFRSVVFIKGGAHRNYFSGTNFYLQIFIENRTASHAEYCSKHRDKYHVAMNQTEPHPQVANQEQDKTYWRIIR